jgi:translation initiation factor IF-3
VRLIGEDGQQVGVLKIEDALRYAQERDLDLVEVAPEARPPVCRVLDYSKYKYEQAQKQKAARKHQQQITIREMKFRPKIAQHDYDTKKGRVERFLKQKSKVKITIMFRGREVTHPERGRAILERLAEELAEVGVVEQHPTQDGRNMTMMLGPSKAALAGKVDHDEHDDHEEPHDDHIDADDLDTDEGTDTTAEGEEVLPGDADDATDEPQAAAAEPEPEALEPEAVEPEPIEPEAVAEDAKADEATPDAAGVEEAATPAAAEA